MIIIIQIIIKKVRRKVKTSSIDEPILFENASKNSKTTKNKAKVSKKIESDTNLET